MRRCAAKGSFSVAFSENPVRLKLPSIFTDHWDPFFAACEESDTVVNLHIGSSSTFPMTSLDAPRAVSLALTYQGAAHALSDWLTSGVLDRFPRLKMALSEGQVGWIPFIVERLDSVWHERPVYGNLEDRLTKPPSAYIPGRIYGCVFDDVIGLKIRDEIGIEQIMFETDYPHGDSTWPHSRAVAEKLVAAGRPRRARDLSPDPRQRHRVLRAPTLRHHALKGTLMLDLLITGGDVVDGTGRGAPARRRRRARRSRRQPSAQPTSRPAARSTPTAASSRPGSSTCTPTSTRRRSGTPT